MCQSLFTVIFVVLVISVSLFACDIPVQEICRANGAGVHCHPCSTGKYVVCSSVQEGRTEACSEGDVWDAFTARCVPKGENSAPCATGVNIDFPRPATHQMPSLAQPDSYQHQQEDKTGPAQQQSARSWVDAAAASLVSLFHRAAAQLEAAFPSTVNTLFPPKQSVSSHTVNLREQMLGMPTLEQLQQLQQALLEAADKHTHAAFMEQDAKLATAVAAQDLAAAHALLFRPAGSSSTAASVAAAVSEAQKLIQQATAAQDTAEAMRKTAAALLEESAADSAGVALAITAAQQQQQKQGSVLADSSSSSTGSDAQETALLNAIQDGMQYQPLAGVDGMMTNDDDSDDLDSHPHHGLLPSRHHRHSDPDHHFHYDLDTEYDEIRGRDDEDLYLDPSLAAVAAEMFDGRSMTYDEDDDDLLFDDHDDLLFDDEDHDGDLSDWYNDDDATEQLSSRTSSSSRSIGLPNLLAQQVLDQMMQIAAAAATSGTAVSSSSNALAKPLPYHLAQQLEEGKSFLSQVFATVLPQVTSASQQLDATSAFRLQQSPDKPGAPELQIGGALLPLLPAAEVERLRSVMNAQLSDLLAIMGSQFETPGTSTDSYTDANAQLDLTLAAAADPTEDNPLAAYGMHPTDVMDIYDDVSTGNNAASSRSSSMEAAAAADEQPTQQQQQQQHDVITRPDGLMLPDVQQQWQQRSRKGMQGRFRIAATAATATA